MWFAIGMLTVALTNRMGGTFDASSVPVRERFDTQKQCQQYADGLMASLPKFAQGYSFVNCLKVDS